MEVVCIYTYVFLVKLYIFLHFRVDSSSMVARYNIYLS